MLKIALSGKMKSGKDTAAEAIQREFGGEIFHIAQSVYDATEMLLGYKLFGKKITKKYKFERLALQWVGQLGRKFFGQDIWLNKSLKILKEKVKTSNVYVVGVRYPNEVRQLQELGFTAINIFRKEEDRLASGAVNINHETETALDEFRGFNFTIDNFNTKLNFEIIIVGLADSIRIYDKYKALQGESLN